MRRPPRIQQIDLAMSVRRGARRPGGGPLPWLICAALAVAVLSGGVQARGEMHRLGLAEVIERAAERSLDVRLADEQIRQAGGKLRAERADVLPELQAMLSQRRQDRSQASFALPHEAALTVGEPILTDINYPGLSSDIVRALNLPRQTVSAIDETIPLEIEFSESTGPRDFVSGKLVLTAPLWDAAQHREWASARSNLDRSRFHLEAVREQARREAAELYTRMQFAAESTNTLAAVLELKEARARLMEDLAGADAARQIDARDAQLEVLRTRGELALARDRFRTAASQMRRLLELPAEADLELGERLQFRPLDAARLERSLEEVLGVRPDLQELHERKAMADSLLGAAKARRYPTVNLLGNAGPEGEDYDDTVNAWYIGVFAALPIWDFQGLRGDIEQAESLARQARYQVLGKEEEIAVSLAGFRETLEIRHEAVLIAEEAVKLATEKAALQRESQEAGMVRPIDVLSAEVGVREAELERFGAIFAYELLAVQWFYAVGRCDRIAAPRAAVAADDPAL
jgi:outer membrane protein TolC